MTERIVDLPAVGGPTDLTDGLYNVASSLGTRKDKHTHGQFIRNIYLHRHELENIYRYEWPAKVIDIIPFDMTRRWRTLEIPSLEPEHIKQIEREERRVKMQNATMKALIWANLYGGAVVVMRVDGHGDLEDPLDVSTIKKGQLHSLIPLTRWELTPVGGIEYNPLSDNFKNPPYYRLNWVSAARIHPSRVIRFHGREMPNFIAKEELFWGDPMFNRIYNALLSSQTVQSAISTMIHESNIDIMSVDDLAQQMMTKEGEGRVLARAQIMNFMKSVLNMVIIDSKENIDRKAINFGSLPELQRETLQILAGATDIPITRFLDVSAGGLNNNGFSELDTYYDMINSWQVTQLEPSLLKIDEAVTRSALGDMPDDYAYSWNPLRSQTLTEIATGKQADAQRLVALQQVGVPEEALMRDAIEMGLTNNLEIETIEEMEKEIKPDPDNEDDKLTGE